MRNGLEYSENRDSIECRSHKMNHFIGTIFIIIITLYISPFTLLAEKSLELNSEEKQLRREKLKKFTKDTFVNRSNERADEETKKADYETGRKIAQLIMSGAKDSSGRGLTIRRVEAKEEGKFGGDIIEFSENINFGHVNTIVRIVTGYIKEIYNYSSEDSELLALYMVYYNLKHRQDEDYFSNSFNAGLISSTTKDKIGLDENFEDWKGQTQFIIPTEKNILKGGGVDIATFEIEDQVNTELDIQKDGQETKKKYSNLQNKKIKVEKEESEKKLISSKNKENEIVEKKKITDEKIKELLKDPEKNKIELEKVETEKDKIQEEYTKIEEEKKSIEKKAVQVTQREEMRKVGLTSEKEYKEAVKNKKLPEVYIDPSTMEVKTKGTQQTEGISGLSGSTNFKDKNGNEIDKNKKEVYSGSANSVGIPNYKNKGVAGEKDIDKNSKDNNSSSSKNNSVSQNDGNSKSSGYDNNINSGDAKNNKNLNSSNSGNNNSKNQGLLSQEGQNSKVTPKFSNMDSDGSNGTNGNNGINGSNIGNDGTVKDSQGNIISNNRDSKNNQNNSSGNKNSLSLLDKNSSISNPLQDALNNQINNKSKKNNSSVDGSNSNTIDNLNSKNILKLAEEPKKKVMIKVVDQYNLAFHARKMNISAREFLKGQGTGFIIIGKKLPVKGEDLSLFLVDAEEFEIKANAGGIVLHKNSPLLYYYDKIIVYEKFKGAVYLTQLNMKLELDFRSPEPIDPDTSVTIDGETVSLMRFVPEDNTFQTINYNRSDFTLLKE